MYIYTYDIPTPIPPISFDIRHVHSNSQDFLWGFKFTSSKTIDVMIYFREIS